MDSNCIIVLITLLIQTSNINLSLSELHSLQYLITAVTPEFNFAEFSFNTVLDGEIYEYYDSNIMKYTAKTEWWKNVTDADDPNYWGGKMDTMQKYENNFRMIMTEIKERYNHTTGLHTVQFLMGCESDDDIIRGYMQFGYDGDDFISLDLKTQTWIAADVKALPTKRLWEKTGLSGIYWKNFVEKTCRDRLKKYVSFGRATLERKVPPKVQVFLQQGGSSPELVYHATVFFPKAVMMSWQKDGEEVEEDVELRETLPNQDGSFQKKIILRVSPEDLQKNKYTCVIQHSSLKEDLRLEHRVPDDGVPIGIIIGVVVGLLVLVLVVVGVVVWKKKNSGYKQASTGSASEGGDSASNGS